MLEVRIKVRISKTLNPKLIGARPAHEHTGDDVHEGTEETGVFPFIDEQRETVDLRGGGEHEQLIWHNHQNLPVWQKLQT